MHNYTWRFPLLLSPLADSPLLPIAPLSTPFYLLGTLLAVTGSVHLGPRLLVNWPPLSQLSPQPLPLQIPRTPITQRLTKTTSGPVRRLLSRTISMPRTPSAGFFFQQDKAVFWSLCPPFDFSPPLEAVSSLLSAGVVKGYYNSNQRKNNYSM